MKKTSEGSNYMELIRLPQEVIKIGQFKQIKEDAENGNFKSL